MFRCFKLVKWNESNTCRVKECVSWTYTWKTEYVRRRIRVVSTLKQYVCRELILVGIRVCVKRILILYWERERVYEYMYVWLMFSDNVLARERFRCWQLVTTFLVRQSAACATLRSELHRCVDMRCWRKSCTVVDAQRRVRGTRFVLIVRSSLNLSKDMCIHNLRRSTSSEILNRMW